MKPLFNDGDIVLITKGIGFRGEGRETIKKGDCVAYDFNGQNLLHRVVGFTGNGIWVQDDAGITEKHFIRFENIIGKVITKNPFKKGFIGYLYFKMKKFIK